jgi:type VI secretion system secreted protein VgrG
MEVVTPLGGDELLFHRMRAREELGRLGHCELELLSLKRDINLDDLLGKNVSVKLALPDGSTRFFNGFTTRLAQGGTHGRYYCYTATVNNWLWFLTRTTDCRIFQDMKVPEIIEQVFTDHGMADFEFNLSGSYKKWTYCVQYRETDFNFISRLMEEEGIYYFVRQTEGHNTVVLVDSTGKHEATAGYETLKFISPEQVSRPELEHVSSWDFAREIQPGVYVHDDYDLERPSVELQTKKTLSRSYKPSDYEIYDYPGHYLQKGDGENYAGVRIDEYGTQFELAQASTNARGVAVGALVTLDAYPRADQNREYLIVSAQYDLRFGGYEATPGGEPTDFQCRFSAMSTAQQFRPRRDTAKPFVQGPQTAVVVGPAGEQIYTDRFGRVKVQFHWDRRGKKDANSSCWVRVSHPWAGKGWGSVATPRIGQEVIVDFLEGDPDQPIITGRVYNAENPPPFGFPAGAVISGTKSDTHKGGGFNELSMDDTAGKERVFIHGQFNMDTVVENDQTSTVHNNRTDKVDVDDSETIGNNQTWNVGVNRDATIGSNETLTVGSSRTKTVGADESAAIGGTQSVSVGSHQTESVGGAKAESIALAKALSIGAAYQVSVGAAMNETIGGLKAEEIGGAKIVLVGGVSSENVGGSKSTNAGGSISEKAAADISNLAGGKFGASAGSDFAGSAGGKMGLSAGGDFSIAGGAKGSIDIASELTLKCGGAMIVLKSGGEILIKGTDITVDGSGKISIKAGGDLVMKGSSIHGN